MPARQTQPEVDFILTLAQYRVLMEVKYRHTIKESDTKNLRAFLDNAIFNAPFGKRWLFEVLCGRRCLFYTKANLYGNRDSELGTKYYYFR